MSGQWTWFKGLKEIDTRLVVDYRWWPFVVKHFGEEYCKTNFIKGGEPIPESVYTGVNRRIK